ncbi:hypothetical protein GLOTRDRAFT_111543 [Gloeophyllum trabeum ATCC 11539]|uniref:LsmAD domain-containing protein n=1 Tax=Gloeophyllum trabeum (strain ATCC 11539 / FP-39264 / Madison 617) TaxID=670483 RepID=S7Q3G8_GLOTA|nr:uncharacterized protein GLOTRDRAFT_111543 [Gloeophyllum trabeum ATCC 11539]EPQ54097.1 hypothetical protein GLOTRDRAFT_111543 [Gloeophyllum trabeum ATCC 11539]
MATTARQPKSARGRGGAPDGSRRPSAWGSGGRASPAFSPASNPVRLPTSPQGGAFPPLNQPNGTRTPDASDRILQALSGLTGTTVTLSTKTAQRYEGTIASTSGEGDTTGVTLKDVKEVTNPGAPLRDRLFIASTNIDTWASGPADARPTNGDTFKTDTDISQKAAPRRERELQAWADSPLPPGGLNAHLTNTDDLTFGPGASSTGLKWDQFTVNETLFGVKTDFDENLYTTKLDRSRPDFKEREREAQRIANEIMGATTNNPHIAEERTQDLADGAGGNEEDKYGAVVRSANAYVPPGARKPGQGPPSGSAAPKTEIPKVSVNAPDGSVQQAQPGGTPPKATSPAPAGSSQTQTNKPPADPLPAFRQFVTTEKERLTQKKQALVKNELDKRRAELLKFSQSFKLNKPIPEDLVSILAKDEEKQRQIREKSARDAASAQARAIGTSTTSVMNPSPSSRLQQPSPAQTPKLSAVKTTAGAGAAKPTLPASTSASAAVSKAAVKTDSAKRISMYIQPIPPFKGKKSTPNGNGQAPASAASSTGATTGGAAPPSPNTARLSVNAPSFKPNPKAVAFTPTTTSPNPSASPASPKGKGVDNSAPPNPFFGPRVIKKTPAVSIRDDFNPFKYNKVAEASAVNALWPYNGKRYMLMFPPVTVPPQQQSPHIPPPGPPPMPPQSYEEDPTQAPQAPRGFVYAYPPYGYPGQPMMPGMPPPPPGYMPGPHMQHMAYPYALPPNAMYASPQMGQMPPPQAYMPPPPGYPAPNGAAHRPSMPPTPIPAHAHPYYHQSPQLQHAVPYPMMMQPGMPPHGYEAAPTAPAPPVGM